jgi:prolyl-tRNA editing enzyme YbaK/EbsC (Cys-tRNA(Pro) deacylase)
VNELKIQEGETEVTTKIIEFLRSEGLDFEKLEHVPVTTSSAAAGARASRLSQGAKAIVVKANDQYYHLIISAAVRVDNNKLRKLLGTRRARFATAEELFELTGCLPGAVPPFGNLFGLPVLMDNALMSEDIVYFNCGSHTVSLRMARSDLTMATEAQIEDFHKTVTSEE